MGQRLILRKWMVSKGKYLWAQGKSVSIAVSHFFESKQEMDPCIPDLMRREILARLRVEGGQRSWDITSRVEYEVLQQMVKEGLIERVHDTAKSSMFTFRLKSEELVESIVHTQDMAVEAAMMQKALEKHIVSKSEYVFAQCVEVGLGLSVMGMLLLTFFSFTISFGIFVHYVMCFGLWGVVFGAVFALTPAVLTFYLIKWTKCVIHRFENIDTGIPITRINTANLPAADSLVRASVEPLKVQETVLLRAASEGAETHEEQLLRALTGKE